jgi:hypothetical protein
MNRSKILKFKIPKLLNNKASDNTITIVKTEVLMILIGINYIGTKFMLPTCYHNILSMRNIILSNINVKQQNIFILTDAISKAVYPSYVNILTTLNKIILMIKSNPDTNYLIYFHYSGHGGELMTDNNNSIISADLKPITDQDLNSVFLSHLPQNVKLIASIDCCFNNSVFELCILNNLTRAKICLISSHTPNSTNYDIVNSGLITNSLINTLQKNKNCNMIELSDKSNEYLSQYLEQLPILIATNEELLNETFFP